MAQANVAALHRNAFLIRSYCASVISIHRH
jgi:hypothetical protein